MTKAIDITGQTFNKLTADYRVGSNKEGKALWSCTCECGVTGVEVTGKALRTGGVKSCGCAWKDAAQKKVVDLSDQVFDRLTVTGRIGSNKDGRAIWLCNCSCGAKDVEVVGKQLLSGKTRSCGCLYRDTRGLSKNIKHGYFGTRIYRIWSGMLSRCTNENHDYYHQYGGRGIKVCDQWKTFEGFLKDVGLPPSDKHTLDRFPNKDGDYEPGNFRWATQSQQCRNRSDNTYVAYNGEDVLVIELAEFFGVDYDLFRGRIKAGWSVEDAAHIPKGSLAS